MKKTLDGRFIERRVMVNKKKLKKLIYDIKKKNKLTWNDFANRIGTSQVTLQNNWLAKKRTMPLSVFKKLLKMRGLNDQTISADIKFIEHFWGQKLTGDSLKMKIVSIPNKYHKKFAEFYGIMLGDGCVFSDLTGFSISGDKYVDYFYYHNYLRNLIFDLFSVYPSIYTSKKDRSIKCVLYSKKVATFLKATGFPIGVKYNKNPTIPKFIYQNKKNLLFCIRGIMDTDGSLSKHPHSKIMIHISITIRSLRNSVFNGLKSAGINAGIFNKGIMVYGTDKINMFNELVGFSNYKNNYKYLVFKKTGNIPSSKEAEIFIRAKAGI